MRTADELSEYSSNRGVEVNVAKTVLRLQPSFNPAVMNLLFDGDGSRSPERCACRSQYQVLPRF